MAIFPPSPNPGDQVSDANTGAVWQWVNPPGCWEALGGVMQAGDYLESSAPNQLLVDNTRTDWRTVTTLTLPSGDWDVTGLVTTQGLADELAEFVGLTGWWIAIIGPGENPERYAVTNGRMFEGSPTWTRSLTTSVGPRRFSVASSQVISLQIVGSSGPGTNMVLGRLQARRMRPVAQIGMNMGVTDGSNAGPGEVGEIIEHITTDVGLGYDMQWTELARVTLSVGDWDVVGSTNLNATLSDALVQNLQSCLIVPSDGEVPETFLASRAGTITGTRVLRNLTATTPLRRISATVPKDVVLYGVKDSSGQPVAVTGVTNVIRARRMR